MLAATIVALLATQAHMLYIFPAPDGARWWGDETGQMLELRAELQHGHACIPTALGSSLETSNGLVRSNSWLAAMVYGLPALAFSSLADLVTIGRTVTFLLSVILCAAMFAIMRRLTVDTSPALLVILVLLGSRSFFYASHAARLDIAAGLSIILFVFYLSKRYEAFRLAGWSPTSQWCFLYGAVTILFATLSIHLLTLLGVLSVYMLIQFGIWRRPRQLIAAIAGVACVVMVLLGIYALTGAPMALFSTSVGPNQFQSVAGGLPILRPFSRSVQISNVLERLDGLWSEAPAILIVSTLTIAIRLALKPKSGNSRSQFWSRATIVIVIAWLFFQSPALYYYLHILPLVVIGLGVTISERVKISPLILVAFGTLICILGIRDTVNATALAEPIARDNNAAITACLQMMTRREQPPITLAQNPGIARLEHSPVQLMTAHFLDFPTTKDAPSQIIRRLGVQYIILYAPADGKSYSSDYATLRPIADSIAIVRLRVPGVLLDAGRDYFHFDALRESTPKDTLILYEVAR